MAANSVEVVLPNTNVVTGTWYNGYNIVMASATEFTNAIVDAVLTYRSVVDGSVIELGTTEGLSFQTLTNQWVIDVPGCVMTLPPGKVLWSLYTLDFGNKPNKFLHGQFTVDPDPTAL